MEKILYDGKTYPIREGNHKVAGLVTFGALSLAKALFDDEGNCRDKEGQVIDEGLYGFVADDVITTCTDKEFDAYINENFD
jgi:hypothetical protein